MRSAKLSFCILIWGAIALPTLSLIPGCAHHQDAATSSDGEYYAEEQAAEPYIRSFAGSPAMETMEDAEPQACSVGESFWKVRVFYGTNRQRKPNESDPNEFYTANMGELDFGFCDVSIPEHHDYGQIERPSIWKFEFEEDPEKHIVLQSVTPLTKDDFGRGLAQTVAASDNREVLIFVHGYNVSFAEASYRTAQITHDLKFDGAPVMYSWPSHGKLLSYPSDINHADASEPKFIEFIETVAARSGAKQVHLVAHSMGNRLVTSALRKLGEESAYRQIPKLNEVILAAPDVDARTFREVIAPQIVKASDRVTIYASSTDRALQASTLYHQGARLGLGGDKLVSFPGNTLIEVIDATGIDFELLTLGHSAYGDELLADINHALNGEKPPARHLQPHIIKAAWRFPETPISDSGSTVVNVSHSEGPVEEPEPVKAGFWDWVFFWR